MLRNNRSILSRTLLAVLGAGALALVAPVTASADHDDERRQSRARNIRVEKHDLVGHGAYCVTKEHARYQRHFRHARAHVDHRYAKVRRHHRRAARAHAREHARAHAAAFRCRPCNERFRSQVSFHRHLVRHHHVPFWRLHRVVSRAAFGWIFYG